VGPCVFATFTLLSAHFYILGNISTLDLSYNQLDYIPANVFESAYFMDTLDLANNRLATLPRTILKPVFKKHFIKLKLNFRLANTYAY
jgi:Leucine-rich repeat (LRR) protein